VDLAGIYGGRVTRSVGERVMHDPLSKAVRYRKEAFKCYELAKSCSPGFLCDFYRRVALHYLSMAEGELSRSTASWG
jgi:hypothetical protein